MPENNPGSYFNMGNWWQSPNTTSQRTPYPINSPTVAPGQFGMPNMPNVGGAQQQQQGGGLWGTLGSEGFQTGVSNFANLANIYMGFKSLGLAKDQLDFTKGAFNKNFEAQATSYNNQLKDQWAARNASANVRGENYQGMDSWLKDRKISG
jgi:hypothetical protein